MPPAPPPPSKTNFAAEQPQTLVSPLPPGDIAYTAPEPPPPKEDPEEIRTLMWTVRDINAKKKGEARFHDMGLDSGPIALYGDRDVPLPPHLAMRFLIDVAFLVKNEHGQRVNPVPKATVVPATGGVIVQPGQLLARFDELTDDALRARVAMLPAIDPAFVSTSDRAMMLAVLARHDMNERRTPVGNEDQDSLARLGAAPAEEGWLDRILPRRAA